MRIGDIELYDEDLSTHIRIMGGSGMGKSTLLYDLLTQLLMEGAGFALLDPHGELYHQVLSFLAYLDRRHDIYLLDATQREITATVNPFVSSPSPDAIETKAQVLVDLTLQVWGKESEAVRADKILYILYIALLEQGRPLSDLLSLLENPGTINDSFARSEWERINGKAYLDSVTTRLKPLTHSRLLALTDPRQAIDFSDLINGKVLLTNVSRSDILGAVEGKTLSAFLVAEIWAAAFSRRQRYPPFYLIIDEFKVLATEELADVLTQAQKFGLHLIFLHQDEEQLPRHIRSAIGNVSFFVRFIGKGEVEVTGWGSGTNTTYIDPEPVAYVTPEVIESYRRGVAIVPKYIAPRLIVETPQPIVEAPRPAPKPEPVVFKPEPIVSMPKTIESKPEPAVSRPEPIVSMPKTLEPKPEPIKVLGKGGPLHRQMQETIKRVAEDKGFKAEIEKNDIDVSLEGHGTRIAVEISDSNSTDYEIHSVLKNLAMGYEHAIVITTERKKAEALKKKGIEAFDYQGFVPFLKSLTTTKLWLKAQEVADLLDNDVVTIRRWAKDGTIPARKMGREWRFDREEILRHKKNAKPEIAVNVPKKVSVTMSKKKPKNKYDAMLE